MTTASEVAWHPWEGQFRLAKCFESGMNELNTLFPDRPQGAQEGTVGDLAHRAEGSGSDHNPNSAGVVRAWDIQVEGAPFDAGKLAEYLAGMMRSHATMFGSVGYVIYNRRITAWSPWGEWQPYLGSDPHDRHIHLSVGANPGEYDWTGSWGLARAFGVESTSSGPAKPITPATEEEDMGVIIRNGNQSLYGYMYNGRFIILKSANTLSALRTAGVKVVVADPADFAAFVRAFK